MRTARVVSIFILFLILATFPVFAADNPGITVTPSLLQIDLHTDKNEAEVYYKNTTSSTIELSLSAQDFTELEDRGQIRFLDEQDARNYKYSLSSWVHFETNDITLQPGEEQPVKVFIDSEKLTQGGHYASLLAEIKQKESSGHITVRGILSSLLFVRAPKGNDIEALDLTTFHREESFPYFPNTYVLRVQNTGNVETTPFGTVEIKDSWGNTVAKGILNEGSQLVLPESIRRFDIPLTRYPKILWPGFYTAHLTMHYGEKKHQATSEEHFFSQGSINFVAGGIGLLALLLAFMLYRKWKKPFK